MESARNIWTAKLLRLLRNKSRVIGIWDFKPDNPICPNNPMVIGGLQKFSLLDYPGQLSAIIFTQGCNFRCQFCYNPMLVWPASREGSRLKYDEGHPLVTEDDLFLFLKKRENKLDAVVITGGEPTLHPDLPKFIKKIRQMNYRIKLDTNGTNPEMLSRLIDEELLDYIAMDIKGPMEKYEKITGVNMDFNNIRNSVKIIMESNLPYEFRTTIVPNLHNLEDVSKIGEIIQGARAWYLQQFKSDTDLVNVDFEGQAAYLSADLEKMREEGNKFVQNCFIR